jgi:hypothetical protein
MLGEVSTKEIAHTQDVQGFEQNKEAAKQGGRIAGNARKELEKKTGKQIVSKKNYLSIAKNRIDSKTLPDQTKDNDS